MSTEAMTPRRCCACGELKSPCRTLAFLNVKAPVAGTGWMCLVCHLPADGALAIVCDGCNEQLSRLDDPQSGLKFAIKGGMDSDERVPIAELTGKHDHDRRFHPELAELN